MGARLLGMRQVAKPWGCATLPAPFHNLGPDKIGEICAAAMRNGSQHLREKAVQASDSTIGYIKDEPVKAMLIAAATGAALMAMLSLLTRRRD